MYPKAFVDYLVHFHADRDYFECHEILEEYWKEVAVKERKIIWVGFIQIAVGLYHHRRENFSGAHKMFKNALKIIHNHRVDINNLGLDSDVLLNQMEERLFLIEKRQRYQSLNLPLTDSKLYEECLFQCKEKNLIWGKDSDISNLPLIHKHSLRDRSSVIKERKRQLSVRKKTKGS